MGRAGGRERRKRIVIVNRRGLHARAAAKFVQTVAEFEAEITVVKDGISVSGSSIMGLMMLAASPGSEIEVKATGPDAGKAIKALRRLIASKFDED